MGQSLMCITPPHKNVWSQVSSSVGEGDVLRLSQVSKPASDSGDNSWDINDPDIPARIEQYVSITQNRVGIE